MLVVPSASVASAVISALAPFAMSSASVLASASESVGFVTSASSKSVTATEKVVEAVLPSWLVARTTTSQVVAVS